MATTHQVKVTLPDGVVLDTWSACDISLDMLAHGAAWTLSLWWSKSARSTWDVLRRRALLGARLRIYVDDAVQLQGVIEDRTEEDSRTDTLMTISGLDLAGAAVECHADPALQLRGSTLEEAAFKLTEGLGYDIRILDADAARSQAGFARHQRAVKTAKARARHAVAAFKVQPGESVMDAIDGLCRRAGLLLWTAPYPDDDPPRLGLVMAKPLESGPTTFTLARVGVHGTFRGNILSARRSAKLRGVPTSVTAFATGGIAKGEDARTRRTVTNDRLAGPLVAPNLLPRPHYLTSDRARTIDGAQREAQRVLAKANADLLVYDCTVQGFAQTVGSRRTLYTVNTLALVRDEFYGINAPMLITAVTFHSSRQGGQTTSLRLVPVGAIKVIPEPG